MKFVKSQRAVTYCVSAVFLWNWDPVATYAVSAVTYCTIMVITVSAVPVKTMSNSGHSSGRKTG